VKAVIAPCESADKKHVFHIYAIRIKERDRLMAYLGEKGISCGIHYPVPVHLQKAYQGLGLAAGSFPIAERCAAEFLSLPMYPELTSEQIRFVADEIKGFYA
jgi:dTDP-4-amino-4,6-dideoxygalactose transaminase